MNVPGQLSKLLEHAREALRRAREAFEEAERAWKDHCTPANGSRVDAAEETLWQATHYVTILSTALADAEDVRDGNYNEKYPFAG